MLEPALPAPQPTDASDRADLPPTLRRSTRAPPISIVATPMLHAKLRKCVPWLRVAKKTAKWGFQGYLLLSEVQICIMSTDLDGPAYLPHRCLASVAILARAVSTCYGPVWLAAALSGAVLTYCGAT